MERLLIFDLDGTLIDSRKDIAQAVNLALEEQGLEPLGQEQIEAMVGGGVKHFVEMAVGPKQEEHRWDVLRSFLIHYEAHLLDETRLYPGALKFLQNCSGWRKALVTNKLQHLTLKTLGGLGIQSFFEWVIGADHQPVIKPDPLVLNPIKKDMGKWSKGVMVGDSIVDMELGNRAGLITCMLSHGFGKKAELEAAKPDYLVDSFEELAALDLFK